MLEVRSSARAALAPVVGGALLFAIVLLVPSGPARARADGDSPEAIASCVQANLPDETSIQQVLFRSTDRAGSAREILAKVWWRRFNGGRSRVLLRVLAPEDLRDSSLLMIERKSGSDIFLYLPELKKVRRVTSHTLSGSLFGSDFTYEDFQQLQGMQIDGRTEVLDDTDVGGVDAHALVQYPGPETGSSYQRVVSYVAKNDCVPLKSEMWENGDRLRKVMSVDRESVFVQEKIRMPRKIRMDDELNKTFTELEIQTIEVGMKIPRKMFEITTLERGQLN